MFTNFSTTSFTDNSNITEHKQALFRYGGKAVVYKYTVAQSVSRIEISKMPNKTSYEYGDTQVDLSGGQLSVVYQTGYTKIIDLTEATASAIDPNIVGVPQYIAVSYNNKDEILEITLNKKDITLNIDSAESFYGEEISNINFSLASGSSLAYEDTIDDLEIGRASCRERVSFAV